jgi:NADPH-dependent 2,4-dienoyl-CoA reductase/sulfur reductase-like enzyme
MGHTRYLIVGGGMTADAAAQAIREVDPAGSLALISMEKDPPYNRPPLSKALWKGEPLESIWRGTERRAVELHLGRSVTSINPAARRVVDDRGEPHEYDELLLATGGAPRRLPFGGDAIIYFRTVAHYRELRALAGEKRRFAVIGGGFIGSEIAAALAMNGREVTMLFPEHGIGARVFPADLADYLDDFYREKGVRVIAGATVANVEVRGAERVVKAGDSEVVVDAVVAGIGIVPNTALAAAAGLEVADGIVVDELLRTSAPHVFAAGDVANFPSPQLGRMRVEHEDAALSMGRAAGLSMAGRGEPYRHLPMFYSDLFDLGYEAVGRIDARLRTVADWKTRFREGVVYYLDGGRVVGVLLVNTWGQVDAARALIAERAPFTDEQLRGRLPA